MVGLGSLFVLLTVMGWFKRNRLVDSPWYLKIMLFAIPLPYIAIQAGWIVTEVGRQPWIVYGVMKTAQSGFAHRRLPGGHHPGGLHRGLRLLGALRSISTCCEPDRDQRAGAGAGCRKGKEGDSHVGDYLVFTLGSAVGGLFYAGRV